MVGFTLKRKNKVRILTTVQKIVHTPTNKLEH